LRKDDPVTIAKYALDKNLLGQHGWSWAKKIIKNDKKYLQMARLMASQKKSGNRYKFGVQVPRSVKQAYEMDRINGNNLWAEAMKKEINQLMEYDTFHVLDSGECLHSRTKATHLFLCICVLMLSLTYDGKPD
jgi:hypothetical protein